MAGRAAEELIFGVNEVTTGSADDIKQATIIAKELIVHYGMGDLGYARYDADSLFSSRDAFWAQLSEETKRLIEKNVERLIDEALKRSAAILLSEREKLDLIAKSLLIHEELNNEDIKWIIENNKVLGKNKSVK